MKYKLEVGMYVRTNGHDITQKGIMGKINMLDLKYSDNYLTISSNKNQIMVYKPHITKASHNLMDLIEEGDYVNGGKVLEIENKDKDNWQTILLIQCDNPSYEELYEEVKEKDIKSIVTREQFESVSYYVK